MPNLPWKALGALLLIASTTAAAPPPALSEPGPIYLWPMSDSLDQYLAEQISGESLMQIVFDPKLASAVLTERIDAPFLEAMEEVFPTEGEQKAAAAEEAEAAESESIEGDFRIRRSKNRPVSRPRGTVFLVDVKTRRVLWSTFVKDSDARPEKVHDRAREVVERLKKDLKSE